MKKIVMISIIILLVAFAGIFIISNQKKENQTNIKIGENNKYCEIDQDCKIFSGCDCGCYNKNYKPPITNRECLCKSPINCSCINNICTE